MTRVSTSILFTVFGISIMAIACSIEKDAKRDEAPKSGDLAPETTCKEGEVGRYIAKPNPGTLNTCSGNYICTDGVWVNEKIPECPPLAKL